MNQRATRTRTIKTLIAIGVAVLLFGPAHAAYAGPDLKDQVFGQLETGGEAAGLKIKDQQTPDARIVIAGIMATMLGAFGIIFVILMVLAGYWLMTARGEEDTIKKAYTTIQGAIIGLIILLSAYSISYFAAQKAVETTGFGSYDEPPQKEK